MAVRDLVPNAEGAVPMRFQLYAEDIAALHAMRAGQSELGELPPPSLAKIVRLAIRELAKRESEQIKSLLAQTP